MTEAQMWYVLIVSTIFAFYALFAWLDRKYMNERISNLESHFNEHKWEKTRAEGGRAHG